MVENFNFEGRVMWAVLRNTKIALSSPVFTEIHIEIWAPAKFNVF
jgi:hypothetical protein